MRRGIAFRRHMKKRMEGRAVRALPFMPPHRARQFADHLKMCSCHMCGNPRTKLGEKHPTQIREEERAEHQLEEEGLL